MAHVRQKLVFRAVGKLHRFKPPLIGDIGN
jgi:hypothetical protein